LETGGPRDGGYPEIQSAPRPQPGKGGYRMERAAVRDGGGGGDVMGHDAVVVWGHSGPGRREVR